MGTYSDGLDAICGFDAFGAAEDKINRAYLRISVADAISAAEKAYSVLEDARKIGERKIGTLTADKPWEFRQSLDVGETLKVKMAQVAAFASELRGQDRSRPVTPAEWERLRSLVRMSMSEWSGVNEGRQYQAAAFDAYLNEMKEGAKSPVSTALRNVTADTLAQTGTGGTGAAWGIPLWVWLLGGTALAGILAYAGYKVLVVAAPAVGKIRGELQSAQAQIEGRST